MNHRDVFVRAAMISTSHAIARLDAERGQALSISVEWRCPRCGATFPGALGAGHLWDHLAQCQRRGRQLPLPGMEAA